jgi:hypothetical protein
MTIGIRRSGMMTQKKKMMLKLGVTDFESRGSVES